VTVSDMGRNLLVSESGRVTMDVAAGICHHFHCEPINPGHLHMSDIKDADIL
jgi:hypothetical protein